MQYDVFISYSRKDTTTAEKICEAFDKAGITYFIDRKGISGGADFPEVLSTAIKESRIFLLLASENAYASSFTRAEVTYAFSNVKNSALLPYLIDSSTMPSNLEFLFSNVNWLNIKTHPIETRFVEEVQSILKDPKRINRQSAIKHKGGSVAGIIAAVVAVIVAAVFIVPALISDSKEKKERDEAMRSRDHYLELIDQSDSLVTMSKALSAQQQPEQNAKEEIGLLRKASAALDSSAVVKAKYATSQYYSNFNAETATRERNIQTRLDSIFGAWKAQALDSYTFYQITHSSLEKTVTQEYIDNALLVKSDTELQDIREKLDTQ